MKTDTLARALSLLALGAVPAGLVAGGVAIASSRTDGDSAKKAADWSAKARKALAKGEAVKAVVLMEGAVSMRAQDAGYRLLLGQAYLKAGRFTSAHQAFADALALDPESGKAALNMALAQIAEGQWDAARETLTAHAAQIPAGDRGLAIALAGDPQGGAAVLAEAARSPDADAKTRQNLALALALSGQWQEARTLLAADMAPLDADKRVVEWMTFARPVSASDQVAALLGVVPVVDPGQPAVLALAAPAQVAAPAAPVAVASAPAPEASPVAELPVETAAVAPIDGKLRIVFAERREVAQALPAAASRASAPARKAGVIAAPAAYKVALKPHAAEPAPGVIAAKGDWFVQLGAFDNAAVARDGWARASRRYAAFAGLNPTGTAFKSGAGAFYRLSVGGFSRADAARLCAGYRAKGGACFVRAGAGDRTAAWVKPARVQLASR